MQVRPLAGQVEQAMFERPHIEGQPAVQAVPILALVNRIVQLVVALDLQMRFSKDAWGVDNFICLD